jgi:hypothetical protein
VAGTMGRRGLLRLAVVGMMLGALAGVSGCSSGSDGPDVVYADKTAKISSNHGHTFTLTAAQQEAGQALSIYSTGSDHRHKLYLSAENLATVVAGTKWAKESSTDLGHSHIVMFNY